MAAPRRKKAASSGKSAAKRAPSRRKSSSSGPPLWLIFGGLIAVGLAVYFVVGKRKTLERGEALQEKISKMAEESPDAEIFQLKEEPVPKAPEKKN